MSRTIFITATDTNAGKTWLTSGLVALLLAEGKQALALKPLASGVMCNGVNEDVSALLEVQPCADAASLNYQTFQRPLAPALAAKLEGVSLDRAKLQAWISVKSSQADVTLVEGVGGLMVPLIADALSPWLVSDWLADMPEAEIMLVVPLRLGCMNHLLLSCSLLASQQRFPKWIILNDIDKNDTGKSTMETVLPYLALLFVTMPQVVCVSNVGDLTHINLGAC